MKVSKNIAGILFATLLVLPVCSQETRALQPVPANPPATNRKALLIGIDAYPSAPLVNPGNDARAIGSALTALGFSTQIVMNPVKSQLQTEASRFISSLQRGDVALLYYAGHGMQLNSENYLVPKDFRAGTQMEAAKQCVSLSSLKSSFEKSPASLVVMILDSCRNNPYSDRPDGHGLAPVEAGLGSYLVFSASPGHVASDSPGEPNGLFAKHLLQALKQPLQLSDLFRKVRQDVFQASRNSQLPYLHDQVLSDFYLKAPRASTAGAGAPASGGKLREQLEQGKLHYHNGQCDDAVRVLDQLVRVDPTNAFAHNALGLAYVCINMLSPAVEHFSLAIQVKPDFAAAYMNRGLAFSAAARYELALQDFSWAIEQEPENALFYRRRGDAYLAMRQYESAMRDFDRSISLNPTDAYAFHGLGKVCYQLGKYREALANYTQALARKSDFIAAYSDRARVRDRLGDPAGAAADRERANRLSGR